MRRAGGLLSGRSVFLGTSTSADSAFYSTHQHSHHHPAPASTGRDWDGWEQQRGGEATWLQGGSEDSPSVPSGSTAQEVRAASRPAGTGRKTSPGSWRQGRSHREGWRKTSLWRPPSSGGKGKGQERGREGGQRAPGAWAWGPGSTDRTT